MSVLALILLLISCTPTKKTSDFKIDFEKYTLENGLQVILHHDKSDPVVAVAIMYHVGSSREVKGKTGFAHLFEHMLFQESENLPQDVYFQKIQNAGGTLNGFTTNDYTTYYEIVPKNALEKVLWMESDRMGYFINTVTEPAFVNQQNVVINEKRQRYDNQPYGYNWIIFGKNMYPDNHPYNWAVIGETEDIKKATVLDVKNFYNSFYGPNNATLVIAGDFKTKEVKAYVDKYFGEIQKREAVKPRNPMPVKLDSIKNIYHEDNYAKVPQLTMIWPTVEEFNPDSYALQYLAKILADGKKAPLYKILVKEKKITSNTTAFSYNRELAGDFFIQIRANEGYSLTDIQNGIFEAFKLFEKDGVSQIDIDRVKASIETEFYQQLGSVYDKALQLSYYNSMKGDPSYIEQDILNIQSVTINDVVNVYNKYIKDKPYITSGFVPKGQKELLIANSYSANIEEENAADAEELVASTDSVPPIEKTPSKIDRSIEPALGEDPLLAIPAIWTDSLNNGLKLYGVTQNELPLVYFQLIIDGGFLMDDTCKVGVANLITDALNEGTKNKTPEQLEEEIELLGANIRWYTANEEIIISGNTLSRNFEKTMELVREMLLEPRWDEEQFLLAKSRTIQYLKQQMANPDKLADIEFKKLLYGKNHILSRNILGTEESIQSITIDDLKTFYSKNFAPNISKFIITGNVEKNRVINSLQSINNQWTSKNIIFPTYKLPQSEKTAKIYFYNIPEAKQSVIKIGYLSLNGCNTDYYPATVMNYKLGGSFNGVLNLILREEKGYTYGARSYFEKMKQTAPFVATASVRTSATLESVYIFKTEMEKYTNGISDEELEFTKNALIKSNARKFETLEALLGMLKNISKYNLPLDYIKNDEEIVKSMTSEQHKTIAEKYIRPNEMIYLIVGDAKSQMEQLNNLGLGKPVLLN
ncbi:MAG: insulinase family protein [Marinilabiliaceae bacterium]|nr:insulinase family protein [Marinilabiliaceae bacterium]